MFASAKGKKQQLVRQLQCQEQCIEHIPYYLSGLSRHIFPTTFLEIAQEVHLRSEGVGGGGEGEVVSVQKFD